MALYKYFKKETDCNSAYITTREIEKADEKVKQVLDDSDRNSCSGMLTIRCKYNAYTAEQRAQIGRYAAENGNTKAAIFLLCMLGTKINESTRAWITSPKAHRNMCVFVYARKYVSRNSPN